LDVAFFFHYRMFLVITFWMKIIWCHYHPLLDAFCHHFLDENYMMPLSSIVGCFLSSLSGWKLYDAIIIHCWMFLIINFWMKMIWCHYHPLLDASCHQYLDENHGIALSSIIRCWKLYNIMLCTIL
jgi:hypothetical protein